MMMGESMRRRRGPGRREGGNAGGKKKPAGRGRGTRAPSGSLRNLWIALAVIAVGSGGGYLYATQVVFPTERTLNEALIEVPDLRGISPGEARVILVNRDLDVGHTDSIRHPSIPAGEVVGQTPLPGQYAHTGSTVELTVSLGPERRPVPDVTRLRFDRALTVLETSGFQVAVDSVEADAPEGQVVATDPAPGVRVSLPAAIRMTVSLGPPLVELPNLVGLQEDEARAILDEIGLAVGDIENRARFGFGDGDVLETFPEAGSMVPRGSAVRLVIRRRALFPGDGGPGDAG